MANLAEYRVAGLFNGCINVAGLVSVPGARESQSSSEIADGDAGARKKDDDAVRVDVKFTSFGMKLGVLPEITVPLGWANPTVSFV